MTMNTLSFTQAVTKYSLARFVNNNIFINTANRTVEAEMMALAGRGYKYGDTFNIRRRNRFQINDGQIATPVPVLEQTEPLVINHQYNQMIEFNSFDLTLKVDQFYERYVKSIIQGMIAKMATDIGAQASQQLNYFVGTPGVPLNSFPSINQAKAKMMKLSIGFMDNAYIALNPDDSNSLNSALANFFNPTLNEDITQEGILGRLSVFDIFETQNVYRQIAGDFGPGPITTTAAVGSGSIIPVTGVTSSTLVFKKGDRLSVSGAQIINPLSYQSWPLDNMQFVVTADVVSTGITANIPVYPAIISDPGNPNRNISNPIPSGAAVSPLGDHNVNVAYIPSALDIVAPPKEPLMTPYSSTQTDPEANVSIRMVMSGDPKNDLNSYRLDILAGSKWHPEYAIVVVS